MKKDYKTQTTILSQVDIAFNNLLDKQDVEEIKRHFPSPKGKTYPTAVLLERLNTDIRNVGSLSLFDGKAPKKEEKKHLLGLIKKEASALAKHMNILLFKYGYDTCVHIPPNIDEKFLGKLQQLCSVIPPAIDSISKSKNIKPGPKSNNSRLIRRLIRIYEVVEGEKAEKNFFLPKTAGGFSEGEKISKDPFYSGGFYDFVCATFKAVNIKIELICPSLKNPFAIDLKPESFALGRVIQETLKQKAQTIKKEGNPCNSKRVRAVSSRLP